MVFQNRCAAACARVLRVRSWAMTGDGHPARRLRCVLHTHATASTGGVSVIAARERPAAWAKHLRLCCQRRAVSGAQVVGAWRERDWSEWGRGWCVGYSAWWAGWVWHTVHGIWVLGSRAARGTGVEWQRGGYGGGFTDARSVLIGARMRGTCGAVGGVGGAGSVSTVLVRVVARAWRRHCGGGGWLWWW